MSYQTDLQALTALRLVHHSWPLQPVATPTLLSDTGLLTQYLRMTKSMPISLDFTTQTTVNTLFQYAETATEVCLTTSPYATMLANNRDANYWGTDFNTDYDQLRSRVTSVKSWLATARTTYSRTGTVTLVVVDAELFDTATDNAASLDAKYDWVYDYLLEQFPSAVILFYNRGRELYAGANTLYRDAPHFTFNEQGAYYSCSLYTPAEWRLCQETYRETCTKAANSGISYVVPFLSLGWSIYRGYDTSPPSHGSNDNTAYDVAYPLGNSWQAGREINYSGSDFYSQPTRFAPWNYCPFVYFYPSAFDPSADTTGSTWGDHFVAYCKGANNVTS